jgi:flagellar protein FliL
MSQDQRRTDSPPAARRRGKWLLAFVCFLLLLGGAGASAWWWLHREARSGEGEDAAATAPRGRDPSGILPLEPFVVNLADRDATRYLRVNLRLVVGQREQLETIEEDDVRMARGRSAILELLSARTADDLVTMEGKAALKQAVAEQATRLLPGPQVIDVLFTEFVVQF